MNYLDTTSLADTIDNVSEALLFGFEIDTAGKTEIANFIATRHYFPNAYANMFAPTSNDLQRDFVLFTGEKIKTRAGKCHMIGEEASRILRKLNVLNAKIKTVLNEADEGLQERIAESLMKQRGTFGMYCCKSCSCSLWLNLASGGISNGTKMLEAGLECLKQQRSGGGKWNGFPYFYTLYTLNEIDLSLAKEEIQYAALGIEKRLKRKNSEDTKYALRRNFISEKIVEKANSLL